MIILEKLNRRQVPLISMNLVTETMLTETEKTQN